MSIYSNKLSSIFLTVLNEADDDSDKAANLDSEEPNTDDNVDEEQPQPEDNNSNETDNSEDQDSEPTENMDDNNPIDNNGENPEENPDDIDGTMDEDNGDNQPSTGMTDPESNLNLQKYQLYQNYETVYNTTENLLDSLSNYSTSDLDDKQYKLYLDLLNSLKEIKGNLYYTMNEMFEGMDYNKLLKIFIYIKGSLKIITQLLKNIFSCENN